MIKDTPQELKPLTEMVCDCCHETHAAMWIFPHSHFAGSLVFNKNGHIQEEVFDYDPGEWAACDPCAAAIKNDNASLLAERSIIGRDQRIKHVMQGMFESLLKNITGPPRWMTLAEVNKKWFPEHEKHAPEE